MGMNLYEFEGKNLFAKHGIAIPKGVVVRRGDDVRAAYIALGLGDVVVKAQVLAGKRGKGGGVQFCSDADAVVRAVDGLFAAPLNGQYVVAVRIEERLAIAEEHYMAITYDTIARQPMLVVSTQGGVDIEDVPADKIEKFLLDPRSDGVAAKIPFAQELWSLFRAEDARVAEINPLVKTKSGQWIAADAKIALDDDAFARHADWAALPPRTILGRLPTDRETAAKKIDEGEAYYRGTAGKYIEMDGDIAVLFSGGGASIANMDALIANGLRPANYTEYSGNPPREKVYALTKVVLSKPNLRGLWICGGVANFTNIAETFHGITDALDELKPRYPIVVRRAGPHEKEGMDLMRACAERNNLTMQFFGKETPMSETATVLAEMVVSMCGVEVYS